MDCRRLEDQLSDLALGEVPSAEQQAHLVRCPGCREQLEERRRSIACVDQLLSEALRVEPSPALMVHVRLRLAAAPERRETGLWVPALATALVLCVVGLALLHRKHSQPPALPSAATALPPLATQPDRHPRPASPPRFSPEQGARAPRGHSAEQKAPEVLVQPGQIEALARLVQAFNRQAQSPTYAEVEPPGAGQALEEPLEVDIRPLVVPPVQSAALPGPDASFKEPINLSQRSES